MEKQVASVGVKGLGIIPIYAHVVVVGGEASQSIAANPDDDGKFDTHGFQEASGAQVLGPDALPTTTPWKLNLAHQILLFSFWELFIGNRCLQLTFLGFELIH